MSATAGYTILDAEKAIRRRYTADNFEGELEYDPREVIETNRWWYIPHCWFGCAGLIVNKDDLYVNWLGSALSLEHCFWGHDHGIYCDLVDFTFAADTRREIVEELLPRFKHRHPNAEGVVPYESTWYRSSEISMAIASQFPMFRRHFVWFAIPEIMQASEIHGLQFTCGLSK